FREVEQPGVIHHNINRTKVPLDRADHAVDFGGVAYIEADAHGRLAFSAQEAGVLLRCDAVDVRHDDAAAEPCHSRRDRGANPAGSAGNEANLARELIRRKRFGPAAHRSARGLAACGWRWRPLPTTVTATSLAAIVPRSDLAGRPHGYTCRLSS